MPNKIFIFEFISGGGFNKESIPSSLFCEGFAMLRSVIEDFKKFNYPIITLLDSRIEFLSPLLDTETFGKVNPSDDIIKIFTSRVKESDSCFIIAPEFSNNLLELTEIIKRNNKQLLSIDTQAIKIATSKYRTYQYFLNYGLKTPSTYLIPQKEDYPNISYIKKKFDELNPPVIIKPDDGVGAESIFKIDSKKELKALLLNFRSKFEKGRKYLIQKFINGSPLSLSLFREFSKEKQDNPRIISINSQNLLLKNKERKSEYFGGYTPVRLNQKLGIEIKEIVQKAKFPEFSGFYGIDFILNNREINFIEINPRLTTPYVGLRKILNKNPMQLLMGNRNSRQKNNIEIENNSLFKRLELKYQGTQSYKNLKQKIIPKIAQDIPEFITPPISFDKNRNFFSCFIATKEKNLKESKKRVRTIRTILRKEGFIIR